MGVNAEGKISLSVELQNFKDIASSLKKGLSDQLKQVPLDIEFNNKDLEKKAIDSVKKINDILSKSRVKYLDLSSMLPNFVNEINKEGISEEIREQMIQGFATALTNLRDIGIKQDYSKLKGFSGDELKEYISDLNDVMDILKTIEGLSERQKQGLFTTVLPSLSDLNGRGKDAAKKEYTKGAKRLDAILKLSGDYGNVLQYGVNPTATITALNALNKEVKSGKKLSKGEGQDLLGYLLRGKFLGIEFGKAGNKELENLDYDYLLKTAKDSLDKATTEYIETESAAYFKALDNIYNSSAQEISYSDLTKGIQNTTNQKMQNLYDAEAPESSSKKIRAGTITKQTIKLKSKKKPELRKEKEKEKKPTKEKTNSLQKNEEEFKFDDEERQVEDIEKELQEVENKLKQVRDKIAKSKDEQTQLKEEITNQEKIFEEKNNAYTTYKSKYEAYANYATNTKYEAEALKGTISNLDEQLEQEKQKKEQIEAKYNQLIKRREELKKEIEEKEKQLETILPSVQEQESNLEKQLTDLNNKKAEKLKNVKDTEAHNKKALPIQDKWLEWYDEALQKEFKFEGSKAKSEAFEALKRLGQQYVEFRKNPNSSIVEDKEAETARFAVEHYKLWQAAKKAGVAESRLDKERFDTDDDFEYQRAIEYLQKERENTEKRREDIKAELEKAKAEVTKTEEEINQIKAQQKELQEKKKKLLYELRVRPAEKEAANESEIKREQIKLDSSNSQIQKIEAQKVKAENDLKGKEEFLQKYELTEERKKNGENRIEKLRGEKDTQEKLLEQKKENLQIEITKQDELIQLEQQLQEKQKLLIQEQKEAQARQEELAKLEEERKKKAEEEKRKQEEANKNQADNKSDSETGTASKESKNAGTSENIGTTIPPEQLQRILDLLENIQKALGTLEDGSDIPSITQSIKDMADALKGLNDALGEIKQKNFNLNIGLPNNNPIGQQGEAKRKILKELEQQYNELNSYFVNKYGDDSSAFNALSKLEGGSNYIATMMSDYSVIGDTNASLSDKIEVYKTLIEQLRNFLIQEGGDINKVLTNVLSPEEIVNKITDDVAKLNPTTAISKIFEDIKVSIDASMAQINTESKGFNFLSGSAEEAAEAKRKFVEANKEVLQSIVASMPKIEQEAKALEKVEDTNPAKSSTPKKENNIEKDIKAEEEKNIELLRIQEARNAIYEQNSSMELEQQKRIEDIKKKELQTALQQNRQQEQVSDFNINKIYTKNDKQNRHELVQDQGKQIQLDAQKEKIEQAKKNYQSELEQARLIEQSEQVRNKSIQDSIKTQKAYSDISEQGLQLQENIQKKQIEQNQKQTQLELEQARFIEQSLLVQQKKNQDKIKEYEDQLQLYAWDEKGEVDGQLSFLSVIDQKTYDSGEEYKQKIQEEKARAQKIAEEEAKNKPINIPIEGQISFVTNNDINQIGQMINRYTETGREQIEKQFASLNKKEEYINSELNIEKILNPFGNLSLTENADKLIEIDEKIRNIKAELSSSFDSDGKLIGDPQRVFELIKQFNNLITEVKKLKAEINSPTSQENIALQLAKDTEKAKKELNDLKQEVNEFFKNKSNKIIEADANKTINSYGALDANGNVIPIDKLSMDNIRPDDSTKLKEQQQNVIDLKNALDEYIKSVEKLKQLNESDTINLKELKQANEEVELLKEKVNNLIKITKKGTTNATGKEVSGLTNKIESLLGSDANLSDDVSNKLKNYLDILKSGATISKASYESMKADVQQFSAEQKKSFSIWDMMTLKMKEGIAFLATKFSFYQIFNQFRQGVQIIHQFDDALTEMMKVSDETRQSLEAYQKTTFTTADAIGSNALQIQNSTADFMRLGESLKEASESAKTANILMNVSEFQSIDEATKSLIAMSAAYDDLSKMQIIDKLNEVGNNYSISTSGAAEALQASASALRTAGNDMDEALALVTAGNQIVQDVSKAGNGLRTIALRLTGTKSAKEELEEMGEETDSLITTQSKLRDTIKEATAVASNQFKGFDILDDNGNYKSTYEIMLGIAQIYQEIVDTDKELGRNNANLLLETVAGKTRANIAASIFQSPDVLEAAYKSSQGAQDSAMRENEKYIESISGHLAQLTNQWQEMWANAANREVINFFIDIGKNLLGIANTLGVIPTSLALIALYLNVIKKGSEGKTLTKTIKGVLTGLTEMEGKASDVGTTLLSLGSGMKASFSSVLPILGGVATAIGVVGTMAYAYYQHQKQVQKELVDSARATGEEWQQQKQSLSEYSAEYEELKNKLDSGDLSEQETIETKQKIYDIQKQITEQYSDSIGKIDLINGELNEQLNIIKNISQAEANRIWESQKYQEGFKIAQDAMLNPEDFKIYADGSTKEVQDILKKNFKQGMEEVVGSGGEVSYFNAFGDVYERREQILQAIKEIEEQAKSVSEEESKRYYDGILTQMRTYRDNLEDVIKEYESTYLSGLEVQLSAKNPNGASIYSDYQSSVSSLESAYASGDSKKIRQARNDFEEATKAKNEFLNVPANNQFSMLFDNIDTSIVDTKNRTEDATKAIKKSLQMGEDISRLESYKKQKQQADDFIKSNLDNLQQIGNIDNTNRPFIFWDTKEVKKQQKALESWGQSIEDVVGGYSTVFGGSGQFDGVDIAFTPIINDGTGKGKLLTKETLYNYINTLIANAGEGWTNDKLFKLDAEGLIIDGQHISNVLGVVGNSMSDMGLTAEEVGEMMHDWQAESIGYIANFQDEWKKAIKQGKTFDEFMQDQEKDLKDITKATNKYSKEDKRLYQALKRVIDLDIDRVDAEQAFDASANGSQIYRNALENLMNALGYTIDDSGLMIDMLVANSIVHGDVADATNSASDAYNQFSQEIATAIENVSKLNTVLTESVSGAGISTQNIDAFKEMFGDDYVYALERSANGYHINAEKLQTLIDKQNALTNSDYQKTLDAQYDALKRCNDEIIKANNEQKDTSGLLAQRQGILQRIQDTQDLMMAYQASTSAFQTWANAQSNGNEYDMYDKIANGYDTIKDLIDRGWSGDDTVRSYLDLIYGDSFDAFTASGEECAEMFDNLDKKIEGTSFSIHDFFQFDSSGKITSNGIFNFFDALKEKQEQLGLSDDKKWIKDDGTYDFGFGRDRVAAEQLGIDVEFFQSMLRAAVSAGFELNLDQPMWAMDELEKKAIKAQEELGGFNDIDFKELYNNLDDEDAYETISGHIDDVYDYIQKIEDSDLSPELKTQQIEQAQDMLSYLVALEREAADKGDINLKATVVGSAKEELSKLIEETDELPEALKQYNWDEITDKDGLQKARNYIAAEIEGGRINSESAEAFLSILDQALYELNLIDEYEANPTFEGNTVGAFNDVKQAREELEKYIADAQQLEKDYDIKFNFSEDEKVQELLSTIYGEGTPEILASLDIDPDKTPEEIIEMLESGERDVDVLLKPDSSELEKNTQNTGKTVVTNNINKQTNSVVNETKNLVTEQTERITNASMDTANYDKGAEHIEETDDKLDKENPKPDVGIDKKDFDKGASNTESKVKTLDGLSATPYVALGGAQQVASAAESIRSQIASIKGKTVSVVANFSSTGLSALEGAINSVVRRASEAASKLKEGLANGTAHVRGTAFAKGSIVSNHAYAGGKWGLPNDQTALTGELGTEIVVRDGNWFTVGEDGAEFVNLKKGDIVFNHKQAQELLENGYVTSNKGRGHLVGFANGTAYSSGSTSGATRARVTTSSSKSSSSRSSGGSGGSGGSSGGNSSSNDAKETKNTLDEVEILIGRIEARISDLDKIIGSTYNTWEDRNDSILDNLKLVTQEISDQRNAYTTYMNKANSINLSESWKQKIRDGAFRIEDVTDSDLWDKIQEYQTW